MKPSGRELVDASVVVVASVDCGAVKVSKCIDNNPIVGKAAIGRTLAGGNNSLVQFARGNGSQLKNRATAQTTFTRRSIQVASVVKNKIADGAIAVRSFLEAVNYFFRPFTDRLWGELVNSPDTISSAVVSRSINIARIIKKQCTVRKTGIRLTPERIKYFEIPVSGSTW